MKLSQSPLQLSLLAALALPVPATAHEGDSPSGVLGKVAFANSCDAKVQKELQTAVAMLHSFWFDAGEAEFRRVLAGDPSCAIATWGIAALQMNNPLAGQGASPKGVEIALAALEQGRKIGAKTERERDYIEAVATYYADFANRAERTRQADRAQAYEALAAKHPSDDEAQIFSALYTAGTQSQADQTYAAYLKAAAVLEKQFVKYPDHPGVAHYLIHSYDAAPIAPKGLPAARKYATLAPDAPHALHMPSHIFTRVGAWADSAATNRRGADVAKKNNGPNDLIDAFHAADYMTYAYLQLGRVEQARKVLEEFRATTSPNPAIFVGPYAQAMMPARAALERGEWAAAAQLPSLGSRFAFVEAITTFSRALGAARKGDAAGAEVETAKLEAQHKALVEAKNNYWATEVEVQRISAAAWIAKAKGQNDEALRLMRSAADAEDRSEKHIVTPGRVLPARELLGDMLMELEQPAAALKEYEMSQQREPNRLRGWTGAAAAADAAGERDKARAHYAKLVELTRDADTPLPEVTLAKTKLAQK